MCEIETNEGGSVSRREAGSCWSGFWLRGILTSAGCVLFATMLGIFANSWWIGGIGGTFAVAWASLMTWSQHRSELPVNMAARQYLIWGFIYLMVCLLLIASWAFSLSA